MHTTKKNLPNGEQLVTERQIRSNLYQSLLQQADPYRQEIQKTRKSFIWRGQYFELDNFQRPISELMILETKGITEQEAVNFPPFIKVLKDVTGDSHYYNYNIALKG